MSNGPQQSIKTTYTESMAGFNGFEQPKAQPVQSAPVDTSDMRGFNGFEQRKNDGGMR